MEFEREKLPFRQGVIGYIFNDKGEILVVAPGQWQKGWRLPGGGLEGTETPEEALNREIKEELNVEIQIIHKSANIHQFDWPDELVEQNIAKNNCFRGQQQHQLIAVIDKDSFFKTDPSDIREYRWVKPADLKEMFTIKGQWPAAEKVLQEFGYLPSSAS